jgi:hypothetical protein
MARWRETASRCRRFPRYGRVNLAEAPLVASLCRDGAGPLLIPALSGNRVLERLRTTRLTLSALKPDAGRERTSLRAQMGRDAP